MKFDVITIFPEIFRSFLNESILKKALEKGKIKVNFHDFRKFASDKHRTVDDRPYGGGPGMILKAPPIYKALKSIKRKKKSKVILLTPGGKKYTQKQAVNFSKFDQIILICGRYEGFDERVKKYVDLEISIGEYVLMGGEIPAMVLIESISRYIPGILGKKESLLEETYSLNPDYIEYPQYTRPPEFKGAKVPKILLSGDHGEVKKWRLKKSKTKK